MIRDLLFAGKRRFGEFLDSPESIPTNILSDRLRRLEEGGLVVKAPYQERPVRYEYRPTAKGMDLFPMLRALVQWAVRHLPSVSPPPPGVLERYEENFRRLSASPSGPEDPRFAPGCPDSE